LCHPFFINSTSQGFIHKNVAKEIGNDNNWSAEEHPSIKIIKENKKEIPKLIFHEIENDFVSKQINKANSKKATDVMAYF
jgi:hypothetical protein